MRSPQRSRSKRSGGFSSLFVPCGGGSKVASTVRRGGCSVLGVHAPTAQTRPLENQQAFIIHVHWKAAVRIGRGGGGGGGSGARSASGSVGSEFPASHFT